MTKSLPTETELQEAWDQLRDIHADHLQMFGVKMPRTDAYNGYNKSIWLAVLYHFENERVHKDVISDVCQRDNPGTGRDQQVRHLKRDGWHLTGDGGFHQLDPFQPSPEWITESNRRTGRLNAETFDDLRRVFGNRCATCGAREGQPDPRYGQDKVVLQHGHMDPSLPADSRENIIPQCQFCNRQYRGDFVFDDKGRVRAVADVGPVKRSSSHVQNKIFEWLKSKFGR